MREIDGLVVGGGPSGLATAYALQGNTLVLERHDRVGGLCRSFSHGGGVFDVGGHSFHTPHSDVYALVQSLLPGGLYEQQRDARVFCSNTIIPYPFQKFYDRLPDPAVVRACEEGLRQVSVNGPPPENFEEYIVGKFGQGIADHFMLPYNRKLWARDVRRISCEWTSERVAGAKGEKERFEKSGGERKPLQPDTRVGYPHEGGYEEIYKSLARHVPAVELNREVMRIDPRNRIATTADGSSYRYRYLVSTIPLPILVRIVERTPEDVREAADRLEYMSLRVELLLTGRPLETPIQRIYISEPEIPPHKIALNHNSSAHLRVRPHHAIMAEVSLSAEKPVQVMEIAPKTIEFLCEVGILETTKDIIWRGHLDVKYAYPVYTHERPGLVAYVKEWMSLHDIYTLGRFGDWEYINSDKCVAKGLALGRELRARY